MNPYPKKILSLEQQLQSYVDAKMAIPSRKEANEALTTIGYYRLRGYSFQWYDNARKAYQPGVSFSDVIALYHFDMELSRLLFSMIMDIEVSLRVRLVEALVLHNDPLILMDSTVFDDKQLFWKNLSAVAAEIARSNDVFIKHNFKNHDGEIPIWAAVEIMSFGTLSKTIKNLKTGAGSSYAILADYYKFKTQKGNMAVPSKGMFSSWVQAVSVLRNLCAHNSRLYNRTISTVPQLLRADQSVPQTKFNGLYQIVLAMKYLRPTDQAWTQFMSALTALFTRYNGKFELARINFPADWAAHLVI